MPEKRFIGKKVLITGAAGVFGKWIAHAYALEGANLYLSDSREEALLEAVVELKDSTEQEHGNTGEVLVHVTDLAVRNSLQQLVQAVERDWGAPDIVINNAGIYPYRTLMGMTHEQWNDTLDINLTASFLLTQQLARLMIVHEIEGSFINMSSGAASTAAVGMGAYSVSKAGLEMLTKLFALELSKHAIRVNAVVPGYAPGSEVSVMTQQHTDHMIGITPLGRTSGPEDAPQSILFLTSDKAKFITGATLVVDGGRLAGKAI